MRILLVNDDGIFAPGIRALYDVLQGVCDVIVAAPAMEQSGMAQAITVHDTIRVDDYQMSPDGLSGWKIYGTPADCVKLAVEALLDEKPDLIVSGINKGSNLGTDILYSGTVGAAMEAYIHDIPAIAVSLDAKSTIHFSQAANLIKNQIFTWFTEEKHPFLYNVNFPQDLKGNRSTFVFTKLGVRKYINAFNCELDVEQHRVYQMGGEISDGENDDVTDIFAVKQGYISVTPLQLDLTSYKTLEDKLEAD